MRAIVEHIGNGSTGRAAYIGYATTLLMALVAVTGCASRNPFANAPGQNYFAAAQPGNGFSNAVRNASTSVTNALTIEPKVIPAEDPVRLDNQPLQQAGGDLHYRAARVYDSQNNIPLAMSHYQRVLQGDPNNTRTIIAMARLMHRQADYATAEQLYQRALAINPTEAVALNDLGLMLARQGRTQEAITILQQAVRIQPANARYRNNLAMTLVDANQPEEALSYLAETSNEAVAHHNIGWFLWKRQQPDQARRYFSRALQLDPEFEQARQMLAATHSPAAPSTPAPVIQSPVVQAPVVQQPATQPTQALPTTWSVSQPLPPTTPQSAPTVPAVPVQILPGY